MTPVASARSPAPEPAVPAAPTTAGPRPVRPRGLWAAWDLAADRPSDRPSDRPRCLAAAGRVFAAAEAARSLGLPAATPLAPLVAAAVGRWGGEGAAARLQGSAAWAVWEPARRRLWVCRDRLGHRGVVYARRGDLLVVGVDAAAVLERAGLAADPDLLSAADHLHGRFPRPGRTYHRHLASLPPGHLLEATAGGFRVSPYWRLEPGPVLAEGEMTAAVAAALERVVPDHLGDGRPLLTLSGGLDTSSLAAVCRGAVSQDRPHRPLDALTWTFAGLPEADETALACATAHHLGLRHHRLAASHRVTWGAAADLAPAFDSPFCHHYEGLWRDTCRWARQRGFTTLVTGNGGDHLFGFGGVGAYAYPDLLLTGRWLTLGRQVVRHARARRAAPWRILDLDLLRPLAHLALDRWAPGHRARRHAVPWLGAEGGRRLATAPEPAARREDRVLLPGRRQRLAMLRDGGVDAFLVEMARRGEAWGVEMAHPLLDHRLFELAARLPGTAFHRAGLYKPVLRDAMAGRLPAAVLGRRRSASVAGLFRRGLARRRREVEALLAGGLRSADLGLVEPAALETAWRQHLAGGRDSRFWHALTLEAWLRRHHDGAGGGGVP